MLPRMFPNHLAHERLALGLSAEAVAAAAGLDLKLYRDMEQGRILPDHDELKRITGALGDLDPARLYAYSLVNTIGDERLKSAHPDYKGFFDSYANMGRLLVTPEELKVLEQTTKPDRRVDLFVNMSCGTQSVPHLMLEIVGVFKALGLDFASGAGRQFCCGTYYRRNADWEAGRRMHDASLARGLAWGASTVAHMCTQCVNTFTEVSHRRAAETGERQLVTHTQVMRLMDERLAELGDRVPWKQEVNARVLGHGHSTYSFVHDRAKRDVGRIARRIPGVEFVGFLDRTSIDSFCDTEPGVPHRPRPRTRAEVEAYRAELAEIARELGADTVSPSHQGCYKNWMPFSGEQVSVRHIISLLAEALGVAHPNRYQAASHLGDAQAIVEHTRSVWTAWGMTEAKALEVAATTFGEPYATADQCACGKSGAKRCNHEELISADALAGAAPAGPRRAAEGSRRSRRR